MKRSGKIALVASVIWVVAIWCIWFLGDFYGGETQIAMLAGLFIILAIKFILGGLVDAKTKSDQ